MLTSILPASYELIRRLQSVIRGFVKKTSYGSVTAPTLVNIGDKLYAFSGQLNGSSVDSLKMYDPSTDTWVEKKPGPFARWQHAAASIGNKMYVFGSSNQMTPLECYDAITDTWSRITHSLVGRAYPSVVTDGVKLYILGGWAGTALRTLSIYNPSTNTWSTGTQMPIGVYGASTVVVGTKIYVIGGFTAGPSIPTLQIYDILTDTWSYGANAKRTFSYLGVIELKNKIYIFSRTNDVMVYDIATDVWGVAPNPSMPQVDFSNAGVAKIGETCYILGNGNNFHAYGAEI